MDTKQGQNRALFRAAALAIRREATGFSSFSRAFGAGHFRPF